MKTRGSSRKEQESGEAVEEGFSKTPRRVQGVGRGVRSAKRHERQEEEYVGKGAESSEEESEVPRGKRGVVKGESKPDLTELLLRKWEDEKEEREERRRAEERKQKLEETKLELLHRQLEEEKKAREEAEYRHRLQLEEEKKAREEAEDRHRLETNELLKHLGEATRGSSQPSTSPAIAQVKIELPHYHDGEDLDAYLTNFRRIAEQHEWPVEEWGTTLTTVMTGAAGKTLSGLTPDELKEFSRVEKALQDRFRLTAESYRRKFREAKKELGETFGQLLSRLKANFRKWLERANKQKSYHDLRDLLLQEQLMTLMGHDLATFVREREPQSAEEVVKHADCYIEARFASRTSFAVGQPAARKPEHRRLSPREPDRARQPSQRSEGQRRQCYECGSTNHLRFECPRWRARQSNGHTPARMPSTHAHLIRTDVGRSHETSTRFDPIRVVRVNGLEKTAIRDTGAEWLYVPSDIVKPEAYTGKYIKVEVADGHVSTLPIATVHFQSDFYQGRLQAIVTNPGTRILLGNGCYTPTGREVVVPLGDTAARAVETRAQRKKQATDKPLPAVFNAAQVTPDQLREAQGEDPTLKRCRELTECQDDRAVNYVYQAGILYRERRDENGNKTRQIVVPKRFRNHVLSAAHDSPLAGHMGAGKTRERVWNDFYWPGICSDIRRYCASCDSCQRTTPRGRLHKVPLGRMMVPQTPFEKVAVDLIGPILPPSERGHRYALVMVDYATRYPMAVPLKTIDSQTVAQALWDMWTSVGIPSEVVSDRGTQFTSDMMREVYSLLQVQGKYTTPYHAQANGLVERYNGTLKTMMRRMTVERPRDWDRVIPALLFAYREVPQESTGFSPFELLYGRRVKGPMQVLKGLWTQEPEADGDLRTTTEYVLELRNRIGETCAIANQNLSRAARRYKRVYDRKSVSRKFAVGDNVLLLLPSKHNKLELRWQGPYPITQVIGECDYTVSIRGKEKIFHANLLKKYMTREKSAEYAGVTTVIDEEESEEICPPPTIGQETAADVNISSEITLEQRQQLEGLCRKYSDVLTDAPLRTTLEECQIALIDEEPVRVKQYPLPESQLNTVQKEVDAMLRLDVIEPTVSAFNSPIVLVKKKDRSVRFCIDYRGLNAKVKFDAEPIPNIESLFMKLRQAKYLSKFDLSKGYWQIPVKEEDRPKTAFSTEQGQFQWKAMPFGLKTAGAVFSRMMRKLLQPIKHADVSNFLDDVLIASNDWNMHVQAIEAFLLRLREAKLSARPSKCNLAYRRLEYLGHQVGDGQLLTEEAKVKKIRDARRPQNKTELMSFLGLVGYYRKFVPNFSKIATPLTDKLKSKEPNLIEWNGDCQQAYERLKAALCEDPVLQLPNWDQPFIVRTDASDRGLGAVLLQENLGRLQPVAYISRKLSETEMRYSVGERECLAIVWAIKKFFVYLYGRHFIVETDHQPLCYLQQKKSENSRLTRWALQLQQFSFTVRAIPGKENHGADFLSRSHE